ncbi:MAG: CARDB domain-containing protein [Rhabdochlamydiaceae bacterium]
MRKFSNYCFLIIFASILFIPAYAAQNNITDSNLQVDLNYPDIVIQGKEFVLSTIVKAMADQVSNITVTITCPELQIQQNSFHLDKLAKDSTFGNDFNATVKDSIPDGSFVANVGVDYFIKGFFDPQPVEHTVTQTVQLFAASKPFLVLDIQSPNDVFAGESFSIKGAITNHGANAHDIELSVFSSDIQLAGKKSFDITDLDAGKSSDFEFVVQTQKELSNPLQATIHVNGTYSDDDGKTHSIDNSFNIFARQRGMLEIGDANGIWIGQFFIAPVVGVGSIVSSVIGFMIFLWHYKNKKKQKQKKTRKIS